MKSNYIGEGNRNRALPSFGSSDSSFSYGLENIEEAIKEMVALILEANPSLTVSTLENHTDTNTLTFNLFITTRIVPHERRMHHKQLLESINHILDIDCKYFVEHSTIQLNEDADRFDIFVIYDPKKAYILNEEKAGFKKSDHFIPNNYQVHHGDLVLRMLLCLALVTILVLFVYGGRS